jgi:hypothetical protein
MSKTAELVLSRFDKAKSGRYNWEGHWQDIRELVRTTTSDFNRQGTQGDRRTESIFDATAPWALEQLAAHLNASVSSDTDRWAQMGLDDVGINDLNDEQLAWCEAVTDIIFKQYTRADVNLAASKAEVYLDVGGFGTGVLYQEWDAENRHVRFKAFPLADCYALEGANGMIDTMFRQCKMTKRQILQEFSKSDDYIPKKVMDADDDDNKYFTIIHAVYPRKDGKQGYAGRSKKFASVWCIHELKECLRESGFDEFPYHVPRWSKLAGEQYGRSPAMVCLPAIKMVNTMKKTVIKAAQKLVDPPLIVPDDGFMLPIKTSPGSLIFKAAGQEDTIQPLTTNGRVDIGLEMMTEEREQILKAFYVDWIIRQKKKERQTAAEVHDDRNEMLRQMGSILGRIMTEFTSPLFIRTFNLLYAAGMLPPAPASMHGRKLKIFYISPAAKALESAKGSNIQAFTQDIVVFAQAQPEIMDAIDTDVLAQEMAKMRDVTRKIIRSPEAIAALREQRQKANAATQMAAVGKDSASAIKDLSVAQKNGMQLS